MTNEDELLRTFVPSCGYPWDHVIIRWHALQTFTEQKVITSHHVHHTFYLYLYPLSFRWEKFRSGVVNFPSFIRLSIFSALTTLIRAIIKRVPAPPTTNLINWQCKLNFMPVYTMCKTHKMLLPFMVYGRTPAHTNSVIARYSFLFREFIIPLLLYDRIYYYAKFRCAFETEARTTCTAVEAVCFYAIVHHFMSSNNKKFIHFRLIWGWQCKWRVGQRVYVW